MNKDDVKKQKKMKKMMQMKLIDEDVLEESYGEVKMIEEEDRFDDEPEFHEIYRMIFEKGEEEL